MDFNTCHGKSAEKKKREIFHNYVGQLKDAFCMLKHGSHGEI